MADTLPTKRQRSKSVCRFVLASPQKIQKSMFHETCISTSYEEKETNFQAFFPEQKLDSEVGEDTINKYASEATIRSELFYSGAKSEVRLFAWEVCLGTDYSNLYFPSLILVDYLNVVNADDWEKLKNDITLDIPRTEIDNTFVKKWSKEGRLMKKIIEAYCASHRTVGFKQGCTDIFIMLYQITKDETKLFSLFCNVMEFINPFCTNKTEDVLTSFSTIIEVLDKGLYDAIVKNCGGFTFIYQWLLLLFKREFDSKTVFRIWDSIFAFPSRRFHLFIASTILIMNAKSAKMMTSFEQILCFFNTKMKEINSTIIYHADLIYRTFISSCKEPAKLKKVFGDQEMIDKNLERGISPVISQPQSPKLHSCNEVDKNVRDDIIKLIGEEPEVHPIRPNANEEEIEFHLIEVCEHDNWCRKMKYYLKKRGCE
ncbi:hypothetical protein EIN_023440 [Entamoeba invadens IP1]|uniref:hypothetical protein n=1 Tax=Entamoeba invadens IP1 TaxID=370355 RepID=UPI0002C3FA78|nr:hypothetical protein EIN_023440 [Entamoeba invadens IP1]ELP90655.1 hypothetical protein EIN_023440 [Entamoeba invadens IP1]|eukprot:XP_004257426.1 hypothetical protein EIN_023440 [Entamoeba invadens IP1]